MTPSSQPQSLPTPGSVTTLPSGTWRQGETTGTEPGCRGRVWRMLRNFCCPGVGAICLFGSVILEGSVCSDIRLKVNRYFLFVFISLYPFFVHFTWSSRDPSQQRVKKWGFSLEDALKDPAGRDQFLKFLESEFSSENLR